ncbi:MAG: zinc ABC transporter solute-binding protein [Desulfobacteraceae bacterium]|nr:zinc ABC transporter solute-binding protein [Desulfobacteraceae bacterium]
MIHHLRISIILKLLLLSLIVTLSADAKVAVFVSVLPQQYFVEEIGKDLVDVQTMVLPGANPATYEPRPRQMAAISKARLYFAVGVPFESAWLKKIVSANPSMRVVHTDDNIKKIPMAVHRHEGESHSDDDHNHGIMDPHIWLSPPNVKVMAGHILNALTAADPENQKAYEFNHRNFMSRIDMLDDQLRTVFSEKKGLEFMVFHPAWGYFAQAYGLHQVPIEAEGKNPKPARLKSLIEHARSRQIQVLFVQPQFSSKSAERVAREIGGTVVFVDPLALNWMENLQIVAENFKSALR